MRYPTSLLTSTALAALIAVTSAADASAKPNRSHRKIPSWYLSISGAASFVADADFSFNDPSTIGTGELVFDDGFGFAGAIGYRPRYTGTFWDNTRFEFELGMLDNDIDRITTAGTSSTIDGDIQSIRTMVNGYIDFDLSPQLRPYIGGGIGLARLRTAQDRDTVFAYQGMGGIYYTPASFPLIDLGVGYRYLSAQETTVSSSISPGTLDIDYDAHVLEFGLRAYF